MAGLEWGTYSILTGLPSLVAATEHAGAATVQPSRLMKPPLAPHMSALRPFGVMALALALAGAARAQEAPLPNALPASGPAAPDTYQSAMTNSDAKADAAVARAAARRAVMEARMRDLMTRTGITSVATQDAILEFERNDEDDKRAVREAGRNLWNGVRRDAPAERLRALLGDYQKTIEEARARRAHAQTALDARVGYSLDARLESLLWLFGVLGEGQIVLLPPSAPPRDGGAKPVVAHSQVQAQVTPPANGGDPDERPIEGTVAAKCAPDEALPWLEVRDAGGRVWHLTAPEDPAARAILARQIAGLALGARVLVRAGNPTPPPNGAPGNADAPLVLLAIVPLAGAAGETAPAPAPYK